MVDSVVAIWNLALQRIGVTVRVQAEDEGTVEASSCAICWSTVLDAVLEDFPWPFAKRQVALAELSSVTRVGWEHVYALPADFVQAQAILSEETRLSLLPSESRTPFEIVADDAADGKVLCCDIAQTDIDALEYTARITNPSTYSGSFVSAVAWRMATELALALPKDANKAQVAWKMYQYEIGNAFAAALRGNHEDQPLEGSGIRARG
jgi:hypothetical protein